MKGSTESNWAGILETVIFKFPMKNTRIFLANSKSHDKPSDIDILTTLSVMWQIKQSFAAGLHTSTPIR